MPLRSPSLRRTPPGPAPGAPDSPGTFIPPPARGLPWPGLPGRDPCAPAARPAASADPDPPGLTPGPQPLRSAETVTAQKEVQPPAGGPGAPLRLAGVGLRNRGTDATPSFAHQAP